MSRLVKAGFKQKYPPEIQLSRKDSTSGDISNVLEEKRGELK